MMELTPERLEELDKIACNVGMSDSLMHTPIMTSRELRAIVTAARERDALKAEMAEWQKRSYKQGQNIADGFNIEKAELTAHVEELRSALVYLRKQFTFVAGTQLPRAREALPVVDAALASTPETSLAAHDTAVRRSALEEVKQINRDMYQKHGSATGDNYYNGVWDQGLRMDGKINALAEKEPDHG